MSAARCPWARRRAIALLVLALVTFFGETPLTGLHAVQGDSLLVAGLDAGRLVQNGAMADPGQFAPRMVPRTATLLHALPAWSCQDHAVRLVPDPARHAFPSEGDWAFNRIRLRTLSPCCRVACG